VKYTAVVPARSGSKRVPHKNIRLLGSKPLLVWTLEACAKARQIDEVILSTDSLDYWEIAKKLVTSDKLTLALRQPEDASDSVKIFDFLREKRSVLFGQRTGAFILALPTTPFRRAENLNDAIKLFESSGKPVFSATEYSFPTSFAFRLLGSDSWEPLSPDSPMLTGNTRSQGQQQTYHPNGAIYVRDIGDLVKNNVKTLYTDAVPYLMSRAESIDIDNELDFKFAEALV
jgi:CMP-N-acetylneuraminic acid synthetase